MKLEELKQAISDDGRPPRQPPEYLIYMPPSGSPVECPPGFDIVQAGQAAAKIAARSPGRTVAVYVLVGSAHQRVVEPEFMPSVPAELLPAPSEDSKP